MEWGWLVVVLAFVLAAVRWGFLGWLALAAWVLFEKVLG